VLAAAPTEKGLLPRACGLDKMAKSSRSERAGDAGCPRPRARRFGDEWSPRAIRDRTCSILVHPGEMTAQHASQSLGVAAPPTIHLSARRLSWLAARSQGILSAPTEIPPAPSAPPALQALCGASLAENSMGYWRITELVAKKITRRGAVG